MSRSWILATILIAFAGAGCITRSGGQLDPIEPERPPRPPAVEYTVGDFEFTLEGGKMITSNKAGRILSDEVFAIWKKKGYVTDFAYVPSGGFSGGAAHRLTLSGSQYGDSSLVAQVFSGLTLFLIPYTVDTKYDVQYTYENTGTGMRCSAEVADSYHTTVELFLLFAAPVSTRGQKKTMEAIADHVYDQLRRDCAFGD